MRQSGEDYLEAVLHLSKQSNTNKVRLTDIAKMLDVTKPSASRAMKILQKDGFIEQENYGTITLTEKGNLKAMQVTRRHNLLFTFFSKVLGISKDIAEKDACEVEHVISSETVEKITDYMAAHDIEFEKII